MSSIKGIFFDKSVLQMQTTRRFSCDRDSPLCFVSSVNRKSVRAFRMVLAFRLISLSACSDETDEVFVFLENLLGVCIEGDLNF
ncbi:hypothetical protein Pint_26387 [Pistacia integerrima]|uniref:Uncharacterized protein n=1 Tax=Pistacia integerrima TaxID=434235 RepID=A0ACC0YE29_9ROSI|nr:hypothetical protein Pint_26387 [Pistacia integerrima]